MSKGNTIWLLGALSSGKTTQNKLLIESLQTEPRTYHDGTENDIPYIYTKFGNTIASLGNMNESQCCGLDRVSSRLKNAGIEMSLKKALGDCNYVIVESIMSASTWFEFIKRNSKRIYLIHLYCDFEENVRRLKRRQFIKEGVSKGSELQVRLSDANYEFIRKTRLQYKGIYNKFKSQCISLEIDTTDVSPKWVNDRAILKLISDTIK